ncbi:VOC family protein [Christensenellaceae bacterium OttesenSCG-928-K19]|nr:VOC family protein [Christensenellaceae bacterium OttesenSCG-928-K19]
MSFSVFINFNGNCREAVTFYADVFGQPLPYFLTYGEGDASFDKNVQVSEKSKDRIMNTGIMIAGTMVGFSDMPENFDFVRGNSMMLSITYDAMDIAEEAFTRLSENGDVHVEFDFVPGQGHYGMLTDQFGLTWAIRSILR